MRTDRGVVGIRLIDLPWHPPVFAVTIVLDYWVDTAVSPYAAVRSVLIGVLVGIGILLVAWVLVREPAKAGVLATGVIALLYAKFLTVLVIDIGERAPVLIAVWLVALVAAAALALRLLRRRTGAWSYPRFNVVLNYAAIIYLVTTLVLAVLGGRVATAIRDLDQGVPLVQAASVPVNGSAAEGSPDIYVILLDGYPRADVLEEGFGFDNRPFVSRLEERGFTIADASTSADIWTQQSLTSMLHMEPVDEIETLRAVLDGRIPKDPALRNLVNDNPTFDVARSAGYQVIAVGYEFEQVALRQADVYIEPDSMNEFELNLLVSTFLGDVVAALAPDFASSQHRAWIDFQVGALARIAEDREGPRPRLVFGHIPAPHQPAVFGADGEPRTVAMDRHFFADSPAERGEPPEEFAEAYRDQLVYLNALYLEMVDAILAKSAEPPVIVLWGDHGSASEVDWNDTLPEDADPAALRERTSTLFAAHTPDGAALFPNDIQPVDIMRLVADAYMGTDLGRWSDASAER